jgi:hypothetical protein
MPARAQLIDLHQGRLDQLLYGLHVAASSATIGVQLRHRSQRRNCPNQRHRTMASTAVRDHWGKFHATQMTSIQPSRYELNQTRHTDYSVGGGCHRLIREQATSTASRARGLSWATRVVSRRAKLRRMPPQVGCRCAISFRIYGLSDRHEQS